MASSSEDPTLEVDDVELGSNSSKSSGGKSERLAERSRTSGVLETGEQSPRREHEEELKWSDWDKLSSYDRLRTAVLKQLPRGSRSEQDLGYETVDAATLNPKLNQDFIDHIFQTSPDDDNDRFLAKIRSRMDKADVKLPTVEVRYENLSLNAKCEIGSRSLPTLYNTTVTGLDNIVNLVNLSFKKTADFNILHDVSGILKPGRMTLLLGPPGCGKTSLLLALAGKLEHTVKVEGELTYNGHTFNEFSPIRTSAYVAQDDLHIAEFTVRETLDYAAQYQGVGSRLDLLKETIQKEKELGIHPEPEVDFYMKSSAFQGVAHDIVTDHVVKILGLEICADTLVGDEMIRGISGGQKKRVTIGEMIVGPARVYFMDEITNGLDSATAFQIMTCLGQFAHRLDMTLLVALLQPPPEIFNLFDDVILLSDGQIVYHGPCDEALPFFESCGFRCPPRKGIADFLQEVTSRKDQEQYWSDKSKRYQYVSVHTFNTAYRNSPPGVRLREELATPYDKTQSHKEALVRKEWPLAQKDLFKITFMKEKLFLRRNAFIYVFKAVQMMIQALILGTLALRTEMHRRNLRDSTLWNAVLYTGALTVMFTGFTDLILTVVRLPFFYKQRDMKFIPGWAFALSTFATRLPFSLTESIAFLAIFYYPVGFAPAGGRFLKVLLIIVFAHQMASSMFRMLAGICGHLILANSVGAFTLVAIFSLGGFLITRSRFKPWWLWAYWIAPITWPVIAINDVEFLSPQWNERALPGDNKTLGHRQLHNSGLYGRGFWFWIAFGIVLVYIVIFNWVFGLALTYRKGPGRPRAVVSQKLLATSKASRATDQHLTTELKGSVSEDRSSGASPGSTDQHALSKRSDSGPSELTKGLSSGAEFSRKSSSSDKRSSLDVYREAAGVTTKHGMVLPFQPLSISFDKVNYFVDMPAEMKVHGATGDKLQLLRDITGAFRPGVLTALVGVTGAGKSTLMDVLLGRKTRGIVQGDIRISGYPQKKETFARVSGYCEQNDIHSPQLTVHESLTFSAWLRLHSDVNDATKRQFVEEVTELVELKNLKDALVGVNSKSGLSIEQRKRLTIAVELVANPSIIFMDEPTSGLDARAAAIVMRAVRNTVDTGRTVVCTIHQPSIDIFESFDELLLLKLGGRAIYAGPLGQYSAELTKYFEEIPGIPKIRDGYNPATWMLEVTTMAMEKKLGVDFADIYENSAQYQRTKQLVEELSHPPPGMADLSFPTQFSQSYPQQLMSLLWKQNLTYWRFPDYNVVRYLFVLCLGFFYGTLFLHVGQKRSSQYNINEVVASVYASGLMMGIVMAMTVQPVTTIERSVFYRERAAGLYSPIPFALSQLIIEIPYTLVQALIYSLLTYSLINLEWKADKFFLYMYFSFMVLIVYIYYAMMMVALTPNLQLANVCSVFFFNIWNFFSGFVVPKPLMPVWWAWYYWACPLSWCIYGSVVSQFGDLNDKFISVIGFEEKMSIPHYLKVTYGYRHDWLGYTVAMAAFFPVLFGIVFIISIKVLNYQQR